MSRLEKILFPFAIACLLPVGAMAQDLPGRHPGYLHALSDLRAARWFLYHQPGDARVSGDEDLGITEIDAAIGEIKRASIDDGKNLDDHPSVDVKERGSRLLKSIEALRKARADVGGEEDNPDVRELRHRALEHIDRAIAAAENAHSAWLASINGDAMGLPGRHPGYLHALSDLRAARWFLYRQPGDARVYGDEDVGISEIDAAIGEIKKASIDDGKNLDDHPAIDTREHGSRLLRSIETLKKARADVSGEEDNPEVRELRHRALEHIDRAIHAAERAHAAWLADMQR